MHDPWAAGILLLCAVVGLLDAAYFVLVTYGLLAPDARLVPAFCRMDQGTCASILRDPSARLFGLPNAVYGLAWYAVVGAAAVAGYAGVALPGWTCPALLVVSGLTVLASAYLAWVLVARLRTFCSLCFLGHGLNLIILEGLAWWCIA